jgi:hypothetical protein
MTRNTGAAQSTRLRDLFNRVLYCVICIYNTCYTRIIAENIVETE